MQQTETGETYVNVHNAKDVLEGTIINIINMHHDIPRETLYDEIIVLDPIDETLCLERCKLISTILVICIIIGFIIAGTTLNNE